MRDPQEKWLLFGVDLTVLIIAWFLAGLVIMLISPADTELVTVLTYPVILSGGLSLIMLVLFTYLGHYHYSQVWLVQWGQIVKAVLCCLACDLAFHLIYTKATYLWSVTLWLVLLVLLPLGRRLVFYMSRYFGGWTTNITIVGHAKSTMRALLILDAERYLGYDIARIIILDSDDEWDAHQLPASLAECDITFEPLVPADTILDVDHELYVIAPEHTPMGPELNACMSALKERRIGYLVVKPFEWHPNSMFKANNLCSQGLWVKASSAVKLHMPLAGFIKRSFDVVASLILLLLLAPYLFYMALRIGKDGGAIFQPVRSAGKGGNEFVRYEFRTQVKEPDKALKKLLKEDPYAQKLLDANHPLPLDPRISSFGRIMRERGLHRLPQLYNVLKGDMSMVGPSPIDADKVEQHLPYFSSTYGSLRPGLCAIESPYDLMAMGDDQRAAMMVSYTQHWCVTGDLKLCFSKLNIS